MQLYLIRLQDHEFQLTFTSLQLLKKKYNRHQKMKQKRKTYNIVNSDGTPPTWTKSTPVT